MSTIVQAWVFQHAEVKLADRLVLLAIADEADDDGSNAYPSLRRIAHKARVSVGTASEAVRRLETAGVLSVTRPERTGRGHFNTYRVLMVVPDKGSKSEPSDNGSNARERAETRGNARPKGDTDPQTHRPTDPKKPRPRFPEFDALVDAFGEPGTTSEGSFIAKIARKLKADGKTPDEIRDRAKRAVARFPSCSPRYVDDNWSRLGPPGGREWSWEDLHGEPEG